MFFASRMLKNYIAWPNRAGRTAGVDAGTHLRHHATHEALTLYRAGGLFYCCGIEVGNP
jgi:hypothetical protein